MNKGTAIKHMGLPSLGNTLPSVAEVIRLVASGLNRAQVFFGHGTVSAADEARVLVFHVLHLDFDVPDYFYQTRVSEEEYTQINQLFQRRINERLPLPYLTHRAYCAGLSFYVDPRVLIPRSLIGEMIQAQFSPWMEYANIHRLLDLGTGSGALAIAMAHYLPGTEVVAVDKSSDALAVAKKNIDDAGLMERIQLVRSDWFSELPPQCFDVIVSNPPYVLESSYQTLPAEYLHEPRTALLAGKDGLDDIRRILAKAPAYLSAHGLLIIEIGEAEKELRAAFPDVPWIWPVLEHDAEDTAGENPGVVILRAVDCQPSVLKVSA